MYKLTRDRLRKRNRVGLQCLFTSVWIHNNICKQCIANNILFAFLLGSKETGVSGVTLWCQPVHSSLPTDQFQLESTEADRSQTIRQVIMQTFCKWAGMEALLRALCWRKLQYELHSHCPCERGCCRCHKTRGKMSLRIGTSLASDNSHGSEWKKIKSNTHPLKMSFQGTGCFHCLGDSFKLDTSKNWQLVNHFAQMFQCRVRTAEARLGVWRQCVPWGLERALLWPIWQALLLGTVLHTLVRAVKGCPQD